MQVIWHLQVCKEPLCHPRLQEKTWRKSGFLRCWILMKLSQKLWKDNPFHLPSFQGQPGTLHPQGWDFENGESWQDSWDWISIELSQRGFSLSSDTIVMSNRNSRRRHGGKRESWEGSWSFMMYNEIFTELLFHLTASCTSKSSMIQEEKLRKDRVFTVVFDGYFLKTLCIKFDLLDN